MKLDEVLIMKGSSNYTSGGGAFSTVSIKASTKQADVPEQTLFNREVKAKDQEPADWKEYSELDVEKLKIYYDDLPPDEEYRKMIYKLLKKREE